MAVGALDGLTKSYFDLRWHLDPVGASQSGVTSHDGRLGRFGKATLAPHLAAMKSLTMALEEAATDGLDDEIDRTALLNDLRVTQMRFEKERPQVRNPEFWLSHLLNGLYVLLARRDRPDEHRARALTERLEEVPAFLDDARGTLTDPVRVFCETGRRMSAAGLALVKETGMAVGRLGGQDGERVRAAVAAATAALESFGRDLDRWRESGSDAFALGEEGFNFRLHYEHVLRDTAPELWRYGHRLKEEIEADLMARARRLDGKRPWRELVARLREDHPSAGELVPFYGKAMERARRFVETRKVAPLPNGVLEVVATPEFLRPLVPFAAYEAPGTFSPDRSGWFYVTPPDPTLSAAQQERLLRDHCCRWEVAAVTLHEGYPGHHLQIIHAQDQPSSIRKLILSTLTLEGWALYCEEMMGEEGFYEGEEEHFFQRVHLLWRALRILIDVGLHTRGMTFEQAVDMLVGTFGVDRGNAEAEVRRYCAAPAYQICYAVGRRELLSLREDFKRSKGRAYTLNGFHEAVLSYGALPISLIRWGLGLA
ncbi:MAG TPA: DUF885 domain-containing protein [Gemmatimonadales bacterium]|nr:DUF885 domain-containing protein [Gemmatimonadales bacterium]